MGREVADTTRRFADKLLFGLWRAFVMALSALSVGPSLTSCFSSKHRGQQGTTNTSAAQIPTPNADIAFVIVLRAFFLWLRFPIIWALEVLARVWIFAAVMSFLFYWIHDKPDQDTVVLMTGFLGIGINMARNLLLWLHELFLDSIWSERRL